MKNIVICCDGTGNEISENISNVLKLYRTLRKTEKTTPRQMVFYDPASARWRGRIRGRSGGRTCPRSSDITTGYGLDDNVLHSYEFIVD